jgi:eukaryotic-like serine/threonine-protein kinase
MWPQQPKANYRRDLAGQIPGANISELSGNLGADLLQPAISRTNSLVGPYRLIELIGSGGMGEVWLAEQMQPVQRRVALKLIKAGMDTREVVARFQSERRALALMDHPTIAKVFDAGSTSLGHPYFAMEYITGVPITDYCDQHKMTVRQRLELFCEVCEGVQHAHQKAIIHRDLKPSNILVREVDGKPLPRIIDFGIAKAVLSEPTSENQFTRTGAILGTPAYMSPEQAGSAGVDVDTRTDVYSLGVVLYELLVGVRPFDLHHLASDEMLRRLREMEAPRLSTKLRTLDDRSVAAQSRSCDLPALARELRGDLDAITLKALEKERSRRYRSPSDLAADIRRYLRNEAVHAVAPSMVYRTRKFMRRYRAGLLIACTFVLILLVAAIVSIRQSIRADREAAVTQAVNDFLRNDLLAQAGTRAQWGRGGKIDPDLKVRAALDRAAARIAGRFDRRPDVEASIRDTIGQTYMDLGLAHEAQEQFAKALVLHRSSFGADNPTTLKTESYLAEAAYSQGHYPEAERLIGEVLNSQRRVLGSAHPDTLRSMYDLALSVREQGKYQRAEPLLNEALQATRRVFGPEDVHTLDCMDKLAGVYFLEGKYRQAEILGTQVLEMRRRVLGPEHPDTTGSLNLLANVYAAEGRFADAEAADRQIWDIRRRTLGPEHGLTLGAPNNLAEVFALEGKYAQAEALDRQLLQIRSRLYGPEVSDTLLSMGSLARDYGLQGKFSEAEVLFRKTIETERRILGSESWVTLGTLSDASLMYQKEGKYGIAQDYVAEVLASSRRNLGSDNPITMDAAAALASVYLSQLKFADSESLAREALNFCQAKQPDDWQRFRAEILLGISLVGQKKDAEAEPLLLEGYQGMVARKDRVPAPERYLMHLAHEWIVRLHHQKN